MKITLCGSTKFKKAFEVANMILSLKGHVVYSVAFFSHADNLEISEYNKEILDTVHLEKIKASDAIVVIDVGDYIGESTRREIEFAEKEKKQIYYFSDFFGNEGTEDNLLPSQE